MMSKGLVCVTGSAGFIGHNLVRALANQGYDVIGIDKVDSYVRDFIGKTDGEVRFVKADCRDLDRIDYLIEMSDVVFHLAAQTDVQRSIDDPRGDFEHNVLATHNVVYSAQKHDTKMVFTSSFAVYGDKYTPPIPETAQRQPISPYGTSKLICEHLINSYRKVHGLDATILRLSNVYGSMGLKSVVYNFLFNAMQNNPLVVYGNGEQSRDFINVQDVIDAMQTCANKPSGTYNIATGKEVTINKLVDVIKKLGYSPKISYKPERKGDIKNSFGDVRLAKSKLDWEAEIGIEEGVKSFNEWLRQYYTIDE